MTDAAIKATFSDFRIVKGRKVAQLVLEVPLEQADAALDTLGGLPMPDRERWVALARLTDEAARKPDARERYAASDEAKQAVMRAGIYASDPEFHRWCNADGEKSAIRFIREQCAVKSRADIAADPEALQRFLAMEGRYRSETRFGPHATR